MAKITAVQNKKTPVPSPTFTKNVANKRTSNKGTVPSTMKNGGKKKMC